MAADALASCGAMSSANVLTMQDEWVLVYQLTHWPLGNLNEILDMEFCKQILVIDGWGISSEIALIWMSLDFADDQSTLKPLPEPMLTQISVTIWRH